MLRQLVAPWLLSRTLKNGGGMMFYRVKRVSCEDFIHLI